MRPAFSGAALLLVVALLFSSGRLEQARAWPEPPSSVEELLEGVPVVIPPGAKPKTSPRRVAMRIMRRQVPEARLVSLTFYPDGMDCTVVQPCSAQYAAWLVRARDVFNCFRGVNPTCRVTPTAYYLVGDRSGEIFGFGIP